jgi:hypothetical protein
VIVPSDVRIARLFRAWREQVDQPAGVCGECLGALLEGRAAYLDRPDPTRWRRGDVRALLYDLAVPRLSQQCDLVAHTVPTVEAFLRFLDQTGRLHPGSTAVRHLQQELAHQAGGFPAAMADRSRWRMAKTLYQTMIVDGVGLHDYAAVDAWTDRFNHAPADQRAAVLENLLAGQPELLTAQFVARAGKVAALAPGQDPMDSRDLLPAAERVPDVMPVFAPVTVPTHAEAADAVRRSPFLDRLLVLARWFSPGRKVTKDGEPVPGDVRDLAELLDLGLPGTKISHLQQAPDLRELFWLARQLELVDLRRDGLVTGPRLTPWQHRDAPSVPDHVLPDHVLSDEILLELWRDVLVLIETGQEIPDAAARTAQTLISQLGQRTRECIPAIMLELYRTAADDQDRELAPLLIDHVDELLDQRGQRLHTEETGLLEAALRVALCTTLARLVDHGALEASGPDGDPLSFTGRGEGLARIILMAADTHVRVRLTPLGRWAINHALRAEGAHAPTTEPADTRTDPITDLKSTETDHLALSTS